MSEEETGIRVFVDAKIIGMHDKQSPKSAYVGYYVQDLGFHREIPIEASESDDAEIQAILFAIDDLKERFVRITVVCDHESVVSEAKRDSVKKPTPLLEKLRKILRDNPRISLEALGSNLAHRYLTLYVNELKQNSSQV